MVTTGEALVDGIQRDLACPQCEYNLRGLRGDVVSCPECGAVCDVAKLVNLRWTERWYRAPGQSTVYMPTTWGVWLPLLLIGTTALGEAGAMLFLLVGLGVWVWLLRESWRWFQSSEGVFLALACHFIVAGYMVSPIAFLYGMVLAAITLPTDPVSGLGYAALAIGSMVVMWLCYRGQVFVAKRCIRRYLAKRFETGS